MCDKTHNSRVAKATADFAEMSEILSRLKIHLSQCLEGDLQCTRSIEGSVSGITAVGAFVALTAFGLPARADELVQHLGPVGADEPILTTFGNKQVIASTNQTTVVAPSTPLSMTKRMLTPA